MTVQSWSNAQSSIRPGVPIPSPVLLAVTENHDEVRKMLKTIVQNGRYEQMMCGAGNRIFVQGLFCRRRLRRRSRQEHHQPKSMMKFGGVERR